MEPVPRMPMVLEASSVPTNERVMEKFFAEVREMVWWRWRVRQSKRASACSE